jgi:hypothetical protein
MKTTIHLLKAIALTFTITVNVGCSKHLSHFSGKVYSGWEWCYFVQDGVTTQCWVDNQEKLPFENYKEKNGIGPIYQIEFIGKMIKHGRFGHLGQYNSKVVVDSIILFIKIEDGSNKNLNLLLQMYAVDYAAVFTAG